jgi:Yip1 domain
MNADYGHPRADMEAFLIDPSQETVSTLFFCAPTMLVIFLRKCFIPGAATQGRPLSMTDGPSIPPPPPSGGTPSFVTRAINILTKPASEWRVIETEPSSNGKLIGGYAAILALLAPIFTLLYLLLTPGGTLYFHMPVALILLLLLNYAIALGVPILLGYIVDALTPQLGGVKNSQNAMKLTIYAGTAYWVGAVGMILSPWLWLALGLGYAAVLLWIGTPILMKTVGDKTTVFVAATIGIWLVVWIILYIILEKIVENVVYSSAVSAARAAYGGM